MTAPQLSPGREWWWTGAEWVPAASHPDGLAALAALEAPVEEPAPVVVPAPARRTTSLRLVLAGVAGLTALGLGVAGLVGGGGSAAAQTGPTLITDAAELDARAAVDAEAVYHQLHGTYANLRALRAAGFRPSRGVAVQVLRADRARYCLRFVQKDATRWYDSSTQQFGPKACR